MTSEFWKSLSNVERKRSYTVSSMLPPISRIGFVIYLVKQIFIHHHVLVCEPSVIGVKKLQEKIFEIISRTPKSQKTYQYAVSVILIYNLWKGRDKQSWNHQCWYGLDKTVVHLSAWFSCLFIPENFCPEKIRLSAKQTETIFCLHKEIPIGWRQ